MIVQKVRFCHRITVAGNFIKDEMLNFLKRFDAFPKANDDFRLKTTSGAIGITSISSTSLTYKYTCMLHLPL